MPQSLISPSPRQPHLRILRDEERATYRADPDAEPPTVSGPVCTRAERYAAISAALGSSALALYVHVEANAEDGRCRLSYADLADAARMSRRQAIRVVQSLAGHGFLGVEHRTIEGRNDPAANVLTVAGPSDRPSDTHVLPSDRPSDTGVTTPSDRPSDITPHTPRSVNVPSSSENANETERTPPKPPKPKPGPYLDGFETFWSAYPRHDNKKRAEEVWSRLKPDADLLSKMLDAIKRQRLAEKEPQYRPMPTTWLNGERWNDESAPRMNGAAPVGDREAFDPYGSWGKPQGVKA